MFTPTGIYLSVLPFFLQLPLHLKLLFLSENETILKRVAVKHDHGKSTEDFTQRHVMSRLLTAQGKKDKMGVNVVVNPRKART